jgi:hypothetical protein
MLLILGSLLLSGPFIFASAEQAAVQQTAVQQKPCDRACMVALMDKYLAAGKSKKGSSLNHENLKDHKEKDSWRS